MAPRRAIGNGPGPFAPAQLLLVLATLLWGGNFIVGRLFGDELSPVGLSFWRWLGALVVLLPLSGGELRRKHKLVLANWRLVVVLGLGGIAIYNAFIYAALRVTTAVNAALFLALLPLGIVIAGRLIDGEPMRRAQLYGMALALLGAVVVVIRGSLEALVALRPHAGDLWMLAALPLWSVYAVLQRRRPAELSPLSLLTATILVATVALAPCYLVELASGARLPASVSTFLGLAYLALGPSALGYALWNQGAARLGAARAAVFLNLIPLFSALLGLLILREALEAYHLAGAALIGAGIALARRPDRARLVGRLAHQHVDRP